MWSKNYTDLRKLWETNNENKKTVPKRRQKVRSKLLLYLCAVKNKRIDFGTPVLVSDIPALATGTPLYINGIPVRKQNKK